VPIPAAAGRLLVPPFCCRCVKVRLTLIVMHLMRCIAVKFIVQLDNVRVLGVCLEGVSSTIEAKNQSVWYSCWWILHFFVGLMLFKGATGCGACHAGGSVTK